jgi:hypothetical protein
MLRGQGAELGGGAGAAPQQDARLGASGRWGRRPPSMATKAWHGSCLGSAVRWLVQRDGLAGTPEQAETRCGLADTPCRLF